MFWKIEWRSNSISYFLQYLQNFKNTFCRFVSIMYLYMLKISKSVNELWITNSENHYCWWFKNLKIFILFDVCCLFLHQSISIKFATYIIDINLSNNIFLIFITNSYKKFVKMIFNNFFPIKCNFFKIFFTHHKVILLAFKNN